MHVPARGVTLRRARCTGVVPVSRPLDRIERWIARFAGSLRPAWPSSTPTPAPTPACRARLAGIRARLGIHLPILDLAGLDRDAAERVMTELAGA